MMDLKLKDKVAIITGASRNIGAGIARALTAEGVKELLIMPAVRTALTSYLRHSSKLPGPFLITQQAILYFREIGGNIININSGGNERPEAETSLTSVN